MKVCKAVFPAAGLGTRFLPATKAQPKEMLPIVDKPIIQYGVEEALAAGCNQIIMVTGRGKTAIEDHFDVSYELEKILEEKGKTDLLKIVRQISDMIHVSYVRQKEALGLGHAVLTARELVGNEPFAVLLADDVIDAEVPALKQMMRVFEQTQCSVIATQIVEGKAISAYGVLDVKPVEGHQGGRLYEVLNMVEKPSLEEAPSNLAIIGRYILTPTIFDVLTKTPVGKGGELQLTDALRLLLKQEKMYAYVYEGKRHDAGDKLGFLKATIEFALKRDDLGGPCREYLRTLKLDCFSLCACSFCVMPASATPIICAARMPAFVAPGLPMATVATGIPAGICTVARSESSPLREVAGIGTPITGKVVCAAITPARCAAPPAPAIITQMPRSAALRAYSAVRLGERWAEVTSIS